MARRFPPRKTPALAAVLALCGGLAAACQPGGDYGYDRVTYRKVPEVPQATNPDPPALAPGALATTAPQKLVARNLPAGVTQAMVDEGQTLFATPCAGCHGPNAAGTPAAPALDDAEWLNISGAYPEIVTVINTGVTQPRQFAGQMPPKGGGAFSDEQVRSLAAYVYALSHQGES
ncbi:MAG TPA: cytochrome c [Longimicrobiaceae bacterium]|nr:cytochrome c [Longimicrobiaceae bacterium]